MEICAGHQYRLAYRRAGYLDVEIRLLPDGSVGNPPGFAERGWRIEADGTFVFLDAAGQVTARLREIRGRYRGTLMADIQAELFDVSRPVHGQGEEMRYLLGLPYVNRLDLLENAVASVPVFHDRLVIIDNSEEAELKTTQLARRHTVIEPSVPLTFTQTQNLLQKLARADRCDVLFFMHTDGEAAPGSDRALLEAARGLWRSDPEFGVAFTNYDVLCAYNLAACEVVGPWDTVFTQYHADVDYYGRLKDAGFQEISTGIDVCHHGPSATMGADPHRRRVNDLFGPVFQQYLETKRQSGEGASPP